MKTDCPCSEANGLLGWGLLLDDLIFVSYSFAFINTALLPSKPVTDVSHYEL
jgi:hypothetical protein